MSSLSRPTRVQMSLKPKSVPSLFVRVAVALAVVLLATSGGAGPRLVPAPLRAAIVVKSVGYEKGFASRTDEAVIAVVLGESGEPQADGQAMAAIFAKLVQKTRIAGRATRIVQVVYSGDTAAKLRAAGPDVVYLASGLEGMADEIPTSEGNKQRIVVCSHGSQVSEGCALGVELAGDKPRLVVNLKRASEAGLRFEPALLRLARVVR